MTTPTSLRALRLFRLEGGNRREERFGAIQPRKEGPSRMPANISPITIGCRIFPKRPARAHEAPITMAIWRIRVVRLSTNVPLWGPINLPRCADWHCCTGCTRLENELAVQAFEPPVPVEACGQGNQIGFFTVRVT